MRDGRGHLHQVPDGHVASGRDERWQRHRAPSHPQLHVRPPLVRRPGQLDRRLSGAAVGDDPHVVDRLLRRPAYDEHPPAPVVSLAQPAQHGLHHLLVGGDLGLALLHPGPDEIETDVLQGADVRLHDGVLEHRRMHRQGDHDRGLGTERGGRHGGHRRIIDAAGDLGDGVGGARRDQEQIGLGRGIAQKVDMLHPAVDARDHLVAGGKDHRAGGDDLLRFRGKHCPHFRPVPDQFPGQLQAFHGRDRSGDPQHDALAEQFPALGTKDGLRRMHDLPIPSLDLNVLLHDPEHVGEYLLQRPRGVDDLALGRRATFPRRWRSPSSGNQASRTCSSRRAPACAPWPSPVR